MAERRPLVVISGEMQELPNVDTLPGAFLPTPDEVDDTDETYFYFGWTSVNGDWLVRRQLRSDASKENATSTNNGGTVDLATAWPNRATLNYL